MIFANRFIGAFLLLGALSACSEKEKTTDSNTQQPPVVEQSAPVTVADAAPDPGEAIFKKSCSLCHQTGVAGAPVLGDKADWVKRAEQGEEILFKHAIEGFNGEKGAMPVRGANLSLTDDEVKAAVRYMVKKSQ